MGRPSTQAKRRDDIMGAARGLLLRHDLRTVGLADIAREMGMTPNAVRYYYADMDHVMEDLVARGVERFETRRREAIEGLATAPERLDSLISAGLPSTRDDKEWRLLWRAVIAPGIERGRAALMSGTFNRQAGLYQSVLDVGQARGEFELKNPSWDIARTLMTMEDYLGFRIVANDPTIDRETALRLMRGYAQLATSTSLAKD